MGNLAKHESAGQPVGGRLAAGSGWPFPSLQTFTSIALCGSSDLLKWLLFEIRQEV